MECGDDRLAVGDRVRTTRSAGSQDWSPGEVERQKWGVCGVVKRVRDSHGLCYYVRHDDWTKAYYEHGEIERE